MPERRERIGHGDDRAGKRAAAVRDQRGGGTAAERARDEVVAVRAAKPGDVVVVAGKGHETYQEVAGERRPFSDARVVDEALAGRSPA